MQNKKLIIGNWKMNPKKATIAKQSFTAIKKGVVVFKNVTTSIASPFVYLNELSKISSASLSIGAQNISSEPEGAHTGEVSGEMLADIKIKYVIIGHSERRALGETDEQINKKIKMALKTNITPVLCVGESDREHGMWYLGKIKTQLEECLKGVSKNLVERVVIAYEPIWAISTTANRRDATPTDCEEMRIYIKKVLNDMFGMKTVEKIKILYGGSVDEKNAEGFLKEGGADGLLIGKSSLNPKKFIAIVKIANETFSK
jgi:triosephosphate isomerase